ncbi:hypothetical protein SY83_00950 [Paenibacillus swuensis]|uniref:histidine kinase n=1 Tax=Paenibacillus swuensis TaxID=1178515 RepID=A0A172TNJ0_9BACL|nr:hypothetical protein SY83_00950 [Paenibacillus swuensis]
MFIEALKDMIFAVLLLLLPVFLYHLFYSDNPHKKFKINESFITMVSMAGIVLALHTSVEVAEGHQFDLRQIPYIVGSLYGGPVVSFILFLFVSGYRWMLGGGGVLPSVLSSAIIFLVLVFFIPKFRTLVSKNRIWLSGSLSVVFMFLWYVIGIAFLPVLSERVLYAVILLLFETAGIMLMVSLVETIQNRSALVEEVRQAEKMKVVGELAASVAHEVRNPLTVTRGFIQLLQNHKYSDEKKKEFTKLALLELNRAQDILSDYLSFAKPQMENVENLDVCKELQYVTDVMSPYAMMQEVYFENQMNQEIWIRGDRQKLHQSLINIVKNSIEAMPSGGTIIVACAEYGNQARVQIRDTGIGMKPEQLGRLGKPYFSSKEKGTGLGMMVVYSIIEAMGGTIRVDSQFGNGTETIIELPLLLETDNLEK